MVLKVVTLTIVIHCIQNFCPNKSTNKDGERQKEDTREEIILNLKAKPQINSQGIKPMIKAKVVAWPLHKINLFN
jgi:hypothetical protein